VGAARGCGRATVTGSDEGGSLLEILVGDREIVGIASSAFECPDDSWCGPCANSRIRSASVA
jgi:hypothetical protein